MSLYEKLWFAKANLDINIKLDILGRGIDLKTLYTYKCEDYFKAGFSIKESTAFINAKNSVYINKVIAYLEKENIRFVFITDDDYPYLLKKIYKPPVALFIKGNKINLNNSISIVGARRSSLYGKSIAKSLAKDISVNGITVVSGLALGIDACAHIGALEGSGITAAVIGSGLMHTYPQTNRYLYDEVLKKGCIISEYFPEEEPLKHRFPERNRIISGLSMGIVIVEAGERSGSLITANFALDQGRDVYVVPGNINSPTSIGCNNLIKDGAKVVSNVNDILEDFDCYKTLSKRSVKGLNIEEKNIIGFLEEGDKSFEEILSKLNISTHQLIVMLSKLEYSNVIKKLYGNYYSIYQT